MRSKTVFMITFFIFSFAGYGKQCTGHFVNPITDVCWRCLFPLSIGNIKVVNASMPDTENASNPIGVCPGPTGLRVGLNIGFWEPMALTDVTDTPYCLVNLGGTRLNLGLKQGRGGRHVVGNGQQRAFFHVHWYKYPLIHWLNLITSVGCMQGGDFDIAYLTELDPTWQDSEMSFVLSPESVLFGNPVAASACAADALSSTLTKKPLDSLFWCAGAQGTHYPMTGHVNATLSPVQTALLLTERMNYKMHREFLLSDSSPKSGAICKEHHYSVTPKSRYRYELVNQVADGKHCYPGGLSTLAWEAGKIKPHTPDQYGFLVWRKRSCTFL
ncbi:MULTISPECIES: conjugal transfer pilus assembly protein TraU [Legionella]|uniref:Conjugal transfer protein TraU n=2 Tax=Legionella TaxID=445 RepID=A0A2H5FMP5_9GAMM|nr:MULTISPECIES: conjugal transfer pilus assembly protein TraU [Legionella]AUH72837.1 conjugal transfer protein TraU [Legionella sainthelensi]CBJ12218.1 putative conjugative transfer protein TraU [Legionella longbeachae NSW150]